MSRTLSSTALASAFAQETDEVWLALVTLAHPDLPAPLRLVRNTADVTSRSQVFTAAGFEIEFPEESPDDPGQARLSIDNVDRLIVLTVRELEEAATVTIEVVLASQPDTLEIAVPNLRLRNVRWDAMTVTGDLRFDDIAAEPLSLDMTPMRFPGMF